MRTDTQDRGRGPRFREQRFRGPIGAYDADVAATDAVTAGARPALAKARYGRSQAAVRSLCASRGRVFGP